MRECTHRPWPQFILKLTVPSFKISEDIQLCLGWPPLEYYTDSHEWKRTVWEKLPIVLILLYTMHATVHFQFKQLSFRFGCLAFSNSFLQYSLCTCFCGSAKHFETGHSAPHISSHLPVYGCPHFSLPHLFTKVSQTSWLRYYVHTPHY